MVILNLVERMEIEDDVVKDNVVVKIMAKIIICIKEIG